MHLVELMGEYNPISFEAHFYPDVAHNGSADVMIGSAGRVSAALCELSNLPPRCFGDVDENRVVDGADLTRLLGWWGTVSRGNPVDWNRDGIVDGTDLALVLGRWGACP